MPISDKPKRLWHIAVVGFGGAEISEQKLVVRNVFLLGSEPRGRRLAEAEHYVDGRTVFRADQKKLDQLTAERNLRRGGDSAAEELERLEKLERLARLELESIDDLLQQQAPSRAASGGFGPLLPTLSDESATATLHWNSAVKIFDADSIGDVKNKIYLVAGIPPYRQSVFWAQGEELGRPFTLENSYFDPPIVPRSADRLFDLPIFKPASDYRTHSRVVARDAFQSIGGLAASGGPAEPKTFFVMDLNSFIAPAIRSLQSSLAEDKATNRYEIEYLYYGFVMLFWPQLSFEAFCLFLRNEAELDQVFPLLAPTRIGLTRRYALEAEIIESALDGGFSAPGPRRGGPKNAAILAAQIRVAAPPHCRIDLRALFDAMATSVCMPEIVAFLSLPQPAGPKQRFFLHKKHALVSNRIPFPAAVMSSGPAGVGGPRPAVTFAVSLRHSDQASLYSKLGAETGEDSVLPSHFLFLSVAATGEMTIFSSWNEEDAMTFDLIFRVVQRFLAAPLELIRALGDDVFLGPARPELPHRNRVEFQYSTMALFWREPVSDAQFRAAKNVAQQWVDAGIFSFTPQRHDQAAASAPSPFSAGRQELRLSKGMTHYDPLLFENAVVLLEGGGAGSNTYIAALNATMARRWTQYYGGRPLVVQHRMTDVKLVVTGLAESEVDWAVDILGRYAAAISAIELPDASNGKAVTQKIRRLKEQDPELFNLAKYQDADKYSRFCQKPHQPIAYSAEEIAAMPAKARAKLVEYWNFTQERPAWYSCPNSKFPSLSFIVGRHPKGYCLPCCNVAKKLGEKKIRINRRCLETHCWTEQDQSGSASYVMTFSRQLELGRLAMLPIQLRAAFGVALADPQRGTPGPQRGTPGSPEHRSPAKASAKARWLIVGTSNEVSPPEPASGLLTAVAVASSMKPASLVEKILKAFRGDKTLEQRILARFGQKKSSASLPKSIASLFAQQSVALCGAAFAALGFLPIHWADLIAATLAEAVGISAIFLTGEAATTLYVPAAYSASLIGRMVSGETGVVLILRRDSQSGVTFAPICRVAPEKFAKQGTVEEGLFGPYSPVYRRCLEMIIGAETDFAAGREARASPAENAILTWRNKAGAVWGVTYSAKATGDEIWVPSLRNHSGAGAGGPSPGATRWGPGAGGPPLGAGGPKERWDAPPEQEFSKVAAFLRNSTFPVSGLAVLDDQVIGFVIGESDPARPENADIVPCRPVEASRARREWPGAPDFRVDFDAHLVNRMIVIGEPPAEDGRAETAAKAATLIGSYSEFCRSLMRRLWAEVDSKRRRRIRQAQGTRPELIAAILAEAVTDEDRAKMRSIFAKTPLNPAKAVVDAVLSEQFSFDSATWKRFTAPAMTRKELTRAVIDWVKATEAAAYPSEAWLCDAAELFAAEISAPLSRTRLELMAKNAATDVAAFRRRPLELIWVHPIRDA